MISTQVITNCIEELRSITRVDLAVYAAEGMVVTSTFDTSDISEMLIRNFADSPADSQVIGMDHLLKIVDEGELVYVLVARGSNDEAYLIGKIAVSQIQQLIVAYKERFDRNNFFQSLLLDNLLLVDVYNRAKKLHIQAEVRRVAMIVEAENDKENNVLEIIRTNMNAGNKDFITAVDENNVIVVKDLSEGDSVKDIEKAAKNIIATLEKDGLKNVRVA